MKRIAIIIALLLMAAGCSVPDLAGVSYDSRDVVLPDGSHHPACALGPRGILGCDITAYDAWVHPGIGPGDPGYGTATSFGGTATPYGARELPPYTGSSVGD